MSDLPVSCTDCNANGYADFADIAGPTSGDCNLNAIPDECDLADCAGDPACGDINGNGVPDGCEGVAVVSLVTDDDCLLGSGGSVLTVTIEMTEALGDMVGGQFFLAYDTVRLDFVSADPGDTDLDDPTSPFDLQVYEEVDETAGEITYATGIGYVPGNPHTGTDADHTLAVLTFNVNSGFDGCNVTDLVWFRGHDPGSNLVDEQDWRILPDLADLDESYTPTIDETVPTFTTFPDDVYQYADAGTCSAQPDAFILPTMADNCDISTLGPWSTGLEYLRDDKSGVWNTGLDDAWAAVSNTDTAHTITWRVTDACGNVTTADQTVTIGGFNPMYVDVELTDNIVTYNMRYNAFTEDTLNRCLAFEAFDDTVGSGEFLSMAPFFVTDPGPGTNINLVDDLYVTSMPCRDGQYDCLQALDPLHTLRRTYENPALVNTFGHPYYYEADFTDNIGDDDRLIGGNLNADVWIDIVDFGIFVNRWGWTYDNFFGVPTGTQNGDTNCSPVIFYVRHADVTGDGLVDSGDFTFIQTHFLEPADAGCTPSSLWDEGPITELALADLAKRENGDELRAADLNGDGWLDEGDIAAFLSGVRPMPTDVTAAELDTQTPSSDADVNSKVGDAKAPASNFGSVKRR